MNLWAVLIFLKTAPANIRVFGDSVLAPFSLDVLGSGTEINTNMGQGGVDSLGKLSGTRIIRMGGIASEYYAWDQNNFLGRTYFDWFDTTIVINHTWGVDQFIAFCKSVGAEPLLLVNTQLNDPGYAANFVEYCNGDTNTYYGWIRSARGHPEPYNVRYWGLGNEQDIAGNYFPLWGTTFYRHFGIPFSEWSSLDSSYVDPVSYARLVREYSDAMRAASPIPIEIVAPSLAGNLAWLRTVLTESADRIDWVDIHQYPVWGEIPYDQILAAPDTGTVWSPSVDEYIANARDSIRAFGGGRPIKLLLGEFNSGIDLDTPIDMFWWNYLVGLYYADVIGHLLNAGLPAACVYSIYNNTGGLPEFNYIRDDTVSMRATGWVMKLIVDHPGDSVIKAVSDKPDPGRGIEPFAWRGTDGEGIYVLVINQNPDTAYETVVRFSYLVNHSKTYEAWQITNDTTLAAPFNGTTGIGYLGKNPCGYDTLVHIFPPYSVTLLRMESSTGVSEKPLRPRLFLSAAPVPSKGLVSITYSVSSPCYLRIIALDVSGRVADELFEGEAKPGRFSFDWKPKRPGVYYIQVKSGEESVTRKAVFI